MHVSPSYSRDAPFPNKECLPRVEMAMQRWAYLRLFGLGKGADTYDCSMYRRSAVVPMVLLSCVLISPKSRDHPIETTQLLSWPDEQSGHTLNFHDIPLPQT
jgi:hypothetical protein